MSALRSLDELSDQILSCRERAMGFWNALRYDLGNTTYWRCNPRHDPVEDPNFLISGTWSAVHSHLLLKKGFDEATTASILQGFNRFRRDDGTFPLQCSSEWPHGISRWNRENEEYSDEYWVFHTTNYVIGALHSLAPQESLRCPFVESLLTSDGLQSWLKGRDWSKPWREGNNVVNLASFYALESENGCSDSLDRLHELADWHDENQNLATGFWHSGDGDSSEKLLHAMAGGCHNLHIYYYLGREIPRYRLIVDSCLRLGYMGLRGACIDIDMVDVLSHLKRYEYRVDEIHSILSRYVVELLQVQNADGGFVNGFIQPDRQFGRESRAGQSVAWATWFRLATLGMAAVALMPAQNGQWKFRDTLGMGYYNRSFATRDRKLSVMPTAWSKVKPQRLAVWREFRYARQRAVHWLRKTAKGTR